MAASVYLVGPDASLLGHSGDSLPVQHSVGADDPDHAEPHLIWVHVLAGLRQSAQGLLLLGPGLHDWRPHWLDAVVLALTLSVLGHCQGADRLECLAPEELPRHR